MMYKNTPKKERHDRVNELLKRFDIEHRKNHFPTQLSGGQQQRVAVARALVTKPKVIFADEPTGNLDSKNGLEVLEMLKKLNSEGTTVVMVTHSDKTLEFASRVIWLIDGEIRKDEQTSVES